jgi:hypothetical protein
LDIRTQARKEKDGPKPRHPDVYERAREGNTEKASTLVVLLLHGTPYLFSPPVEQHHVGTHTSSTERLSDHPQGDFLSVADRFMDDSVEEPKQGTANKSPSAEQSGQVNNEVSGHVHEHS